MAQGLMGTRKQDILDRMPCRDSVYGSRILEGVMSGDYEEGTPWGDACALASSGMQSGRQATDMDRAIYALSSMGFSDSDAELAVMMFDSAHPSGLTGMARGAREGHSPEGPAMLDLEEWAGKRRSHDKGKGFACGLTDQQLMDACEDVSRVVDFVCRSADDARKGGHHGGMAPDHEAAESVVGNSQMFYRGAELSVFRKDLRESGHDGALREVYGKFFGEAKGYGGLCRRRDELGMFMGRLREGTAHAGSVYAPAASRVPGLQDGMPDREPAYRSVDFSKQMDGRPGLLPEAGLPGVSRQARQQDGIIQDKGHPEPAAVRGQADPVPEPWMWEDAGFLAQGLQPCHAQPEAGY